MSISDLLRQRDKTPKWLAKRAKITERRIVQLVEGDEPTREEAHRLAKSLSISLSELIAPPDESSAHMLLRDTNLKPSESMPFAHELARVMELLPESDERHVPSWMSTIRESSPQEAAREFRNEWFGGDQISPILALPQIVDQLADTAVLATRVSKIDGGSALVRGCAIVFVASRTFRPRMLFTLAHELGHLLLHFHEGSRQVHLDKRIRVNLREGARLEREANCFAMCLLLPEEGVIRGIQIIQRRTGAVAGSAPGDLDLMTLSRFFGVSFEAICYRVEGLGLLPRGGAASIVETVKKKHKSPEIRGREAGLSPRPSIEFVRIPTLLLRTSSRMVQGGEISVGRAASLLNATASDYFLRRAASFTAHS